MSGEATRRAGGRVARYGHWLATKMPSGRSLRGNTRGIGWAHGIVLAFGLITIVFGLYLLVSLATTLLPAVGTLFIGVILVLVGVVETFTEGVEGRSDRRR